MEDFVVKFRISIYEYGKFLFLNAYQTRQVIITSGIGLMLLMFYITDFANEGSTGTILFAGVGFFLFPILQIAKSQLHARKSEAFKQELCYRIDHSGVYVEGSNLKRAYQWTNILKFDESDELLVLHNSENEVLLFRKSFLNQEQQNFIRSKISHGKSILET